MWRIPDSVIKSTTETNTETVNTTVLVYKFKPLVPVALWCDMAIAILINIGSGNGLLPDGNKPLPEPMLTSC